MPEPENTKVQKNDGRTRYSKPMWGWVHSATTARPSSNPQGTTTRGSRHVDADVCKILSAGVSCVIEACIFLQEVCDGQGGALSLEHKRLLPGNTATNCFCDAAAVFQADELPYKQKG